MAGDFFGSQPKSPTFSDNVDNFAKAISERSAFNPVLSVKALPSTKKPAVVPSAALKPAESFASIEPNQLDILISNPLALIIDIRPHAAYSSARIPTALSLSVPSTLLKRPLFSLDRIAAMLPASSARATFAEWPKFSTIVIYDVDSTGSPHLPEGNNLLGLMRKFANDSAYKGSTLLWLKGGFQRVWRERKDLVDLGPPEPDQDDDGNDSGSLKTTHLPSSAFGAESTTHAPNKPSSAIDLAPSNPFFDTIRQNVELSHGITERIPLYLPKRVHKRINDLPSEWLRDISRRAGIKDERSSDETQPPTKVDAGMEALAMQFYSIELAEQRRLMGVMKYHAEESGPAQRSDDLPPPSVQHISSASSNSGDRRKMDIFPYSITAGVEKGAKNRYRHIWPFEHARVRLHQRRISPTRHPAISLPSLRLPSGAITGPITSSDTIQSLHSSSRLKSRRGIKPSLGVGGLNGIIPSSSFNFTSRAALTTPALSGSALKPSFTNMRVPAPPAGSGGETTESEEHDSERETSGRDELKSAGEYDDYVNASYIQPLCTSRRYIATQGPLEATFADFWTLVYQQNVHVIVMLTREIEGSMVKCSPYWKDEIFGPLRLKLISVEGNVDEGKDDDVRRKGDPGAGGFFFPTVPDSKDIKNAVPKSSSTSSDFSEAIIKRTFHLSHKNFPDIPPRKVIQFQYLGWPDMNVPDDPRGVLHLIRLIDQAVSEATHLDRQGKEESADFEEMKEENNSANDFSLDVPALVRPSTLAQIRSDSEESLNRSTGISHYAMGRNQSPVLLHCSAGVGRTGGFIAVDAVLDGIRRELKKQMHNKKSDNIGVEEAFSHAMDTDVAVVEDKAVEGNGNKTKAASSDVDMENGDTIAIPANNSGDVLHVPIHRLHPRPPLVKNVANTEPSTFSASPVRTPMQVDDEKPSYHRQTSTTRMWAEDVSDQTGSHGTAVRVDEARKHQISEDRLSEWDVPEKITKIMLSSRDTTASEGGSESSSRKADPVAAAPTPSAMPSHLLGLPSQPLSSLDSASSSDDSYGFQNSVEGSHHRRLGHQVTHSLPYGESALTSSTGTSFSSLQLPLVSAVAPKSSGVATTVNDDGNGEGLPTSKLRGEETRLRTFSVPSAPVPVSQTLDNRESKTLPVNIASFPMSNPSSASWLSKGSNRAIQNSPSPLLHNREREVASFSPLSRSLSTSLDSAVSAGWRLNGIQSPPSSSVVSEGPTSASAITWRQNNADAEAAPDPIPNSVSKSISFSLAAPDAPTIQVPGSQSQVSGVAQAGDSLSRGPPKNLNFSLPRALHSDLSPKALSKLDEPLMEVLQDMREQRMSLCQSLRQYVFVHAAVIEGALMIVDEEKERERKEMGMDVDVDVEGEDGNWNRAARSAKHYSSSSLSQPFSAGTFSSPVRPFRHRAGSLTSTPSRTGKRVASPTELPKENKKGEQMLFKRPSIKKKKTDSTYPREEPWSVRAREDVTLISGQTLQPPPT